MSSHVRAFPAHRSSARLEALVWTPVRACGPVAVALLVAFHAWLLWTDVATGTLLKPEIALRWLASAGILVGFLALRRLGLSVFVGRRAVVLWLLVVMLHCHVAWTGGVVTPNLGAPEALGTLGQITGSLSVLGTLGILWLVLASGRSPMRDLVRVRAGAVAGLPSDGFTFRFAPRPPPLF